MKTVSDALSKTLFHIDQDEGQTYQDALQLVSMGDDTQYLTALGIAVRTFIRVDEGQDVEALHAWLMQHPGGYLETALMPMTSEPRSFARAMSVSLTLEAIQDLTNRIMEVL